jgi:hypothetical protein
VSCRQRPENVGFQVLERGVWSVTSKTHNRIAGHASRVHEFSTYCVSPAAQEIPDNGITALGRNDYAHPAEDGWAAIHDDEGHDLFASPPNDLPKVVRRNDTVVTLEHRVWLDGDLAAPFTAASSQDCASRTRAHAQAETVNLGTSSVVGLKGALGHCVLLGEWPEQSGDKVCVKPQPHKNRAGIGASQTTPLRCPHQQTAHSRNRNYD